MTHLPPGDGGPPPRAGGSGDPAFLLRGVRQEKAGAVVLDGVEMAIPDGRVTALVGPSGAGKTSLLRLLNRLDDPVAGEVLYRSFPIAGHEVRRLRREVGFVFQTPVMFPGTLRDNLRVAAELADDAAEPGVRMRAAMDLAELEWALIDREGERLSVGQMQRANLARALMSAPRVLLLDEPTSALDPGTADRLLQTVRRLGTERGMTVVMVTHRLAEARWTSDVTTVLEAGRVVQQGPTPEVFGRADELRLRALPRRGS